MKTAVIIAAHMRSFSRCLPTIKWHVLRHFPDADFFVSTVADRDAESVGLLRSEFPNARVEAEVIEAQPELPIPVPPRDPTWLPNQNRIYTHEPYALSVHPQAVLRQLWHLNRAWEFFRSKANVDDYQTVIRLRPDSYFRSCYMPFEIPTENACYSPWWGRFGGMNDRFAIMGRAAAETYFTTYSRLEELLAAGCPLHPESLVYASLWTRNVHHKQTLKAEFSKLIWDRGANHGTFRDPEISQIDMAHAALSR